MKILIRLSWNIAGEWTWSASLLAGALVAMERQVLAASASWQLSEDAARVAATAWLGSSAFSRLPVDWEEVAPNY